MLFGERQSRRATNAINTLREAKSAARRTRRRINLFRFKASSILLALTLLSAPQVAQARKATTSKSGAASLNLAAAAAPLSATRTFSFQEGAVYLVQTSPQRITDLALEPGEQLMSVSAGDTTRWIVDEARSGVGKALQAHVLIKPSAAGLSTNLLIMTDRRVYHVELRSIPSAGLAAASWNYPEDSIIRAANAARPDSQGKLAAATIAGTPAEDLDFKYKITGDRTEWRPLRAFDDGRRVFIQMPDYIAVTQAPPLFISGDNGPELVNYRVHGQYYIVDRLFNKAELRLGDKRPKIVRIERRVKLKAKGDSDV